MLPLHEPVPAASSRRPGATVVRGRFEQSTHNAATGSRRHGFMAPMRGFRAVVATHEPRERAWGLGRRKSGAEATAVQTLARPSEIPCGAKRLDCGGFSAAVPRSGFRGRNRGSWRAVGSLPTATLPSPHLGCLLAGLQPRRHRLGEPDRNVALLLARLNLELPPQPPPRLIPGQQS